MASEDGSPRSGAMLSTISNVSPATKRAASTLPLRYSAARSGRAGVRRGSSIAFAQQFIDRARGLAFAAFRARRSCRRRPAIDVEMQPVPGVLDETLQEQRAGDGAGKRARRRVVDIGDLGVEPDIVCRLLLETTKWIVFFFPTCG